MAFQPVQTTAKTTEFLSLIHSFIQARDGPQLQLHLVIEPPYKEGYQAVIAEIKHAFPPGSESALEELVTSQLPSITTAWPPFIKFMVTYLYFLTKVDLNDLLSTYNLLSELFKCVDHRRRIALSLPSFLSDIYLTAKPPPRFRTRHTE